VLSYDQHSENCKATKAIISINQALAQPTTTFTNAPDAAKAYLQR
jgi:hypothetical protein